MLKLNKRHNLAFVLVLIQVTAISLILIACGDQPTGNNKPNAFETASSTSSVAADSISVSTPPTGTSSLPASIPLKSAVETPIQNTSVTPVLVTTSSQVSSNQPIPGHVSPTADGASWTFASQNDASLYPTNNIPVQAKGSNGTLSVHYPTFKNGASAGWSDWPLGEYEVQYQPQDSNSAPYTLKTFPALALAPGVGAQPSCNSCQSYNYVTLIAAVAGNHFLVEVQVENPQAQNGGNLEFWWFEPATSNSELLLTGPDAVGGGRFSREVHSDKWFFFNQAHTATGPGPFALEDARAFLVNLLTGEKREVNLGDENFVNSATWQSDGKLHFSVKDSTGILNKKVLDPVTGEAIVEG